MLKGQQFGPKHGSLSLHADVRRPERAFWTQLIRVIGTLNDWKSADVNDSDASRKAFAACAPMVGLLRAELAQVKDTNGVKSYGARNLDPRCRSSFYAIVHHADGPDERITSTGGRSGGALQELTSFVYGAALIYLLGGGLTSEPSYTTLFLDEALIKPTAVTRSAPSRCCRASDSRSSSPPRKARPVKSSRSPPRPT